MRPILILILAYIILFSFTDSMIEASNNMKTINHQNVVNEKKSERQLIIEELNNLKIVLASREKNKIADIFQFPISDSIFGIYTAGGAFNEQFKTNGHKITKTMFLQYFNDIYSEIQIDQVNILFQKIKIDSLLQKDILEYNTYNISEPCYYTYKIQINERTVTFTMNMDSNVNYKSKKKSNDEMLENDSAICEHDFWWTFRFDGSKLQIERITGAD